MPPDTPRRFWRIMVYACMRAGNQRGCGLELRFYLEDGCEGPHGGDAIDHIVKAGPLEGQIVKWHKTPSGRLIVPVPFVAGGCPNCQPTPPWRMSGPCLVHIRWNQDTELPAMVTGLKPTDARFHYPVDPLADRACGEPLFGVKLSHLN